MARAGAFGLASGPVNAWSEQLAEAFLLHKGGSLSHLMDPDEMAGRLGAANVQAVRLAAFEAYATRFARGSYAFEAGTLRDVLVPLFRILHEQSRPDPNLANLVTEGLNAFQAWINLYRSPEAAPFNWMIRPLVSLLDFLRKAGIEADQQTGELGDPAEVATIPEDQAGTYHQERVFGAIRGQSGQFRPDESRQAGYVLLMSESIQACIALGNIQMAAGFLKTIDTSSLQVEKIPRGPLLSFNYYLGKLNMQQLKFQKAEETLSWAFSNCPDKQADLKQRIAQCLTAVRLRMGKLPPEAFLEKYELTHYGEIVKAMKTGNIARFERVLADKMYQFVAEGTLLCVEKLKFIVYRTLFRRVLGWAKDNLFEAREQTQVPLGLFTAAFQWQLGDDLVDFDDNEMACILANLIKLGYVKGYIAWDHGKIVLAKNVPLPPINSVQVS